MKGEFQRFLSLYGRTIYHPGKAFQEMLDGRHLRFGFLYMAIPVAFYTLMYVMLHAGGGAPSTFTPWLNIPKNEYYYYNQFLLAPSLILAWFSAAAMLRVVCRGLGGTGTFEATLSLLGLSISVAMWTTLIHDLAMSSLSALHIIDAAQHEIAMNTPTLWRTILWICFALYFFAFTVLFYKTVRVAHGLGKTKSLLAGFSAFIVFQLIFVIFNR